MMKSSSEEGVGVPCASWIYSWFHVAFIYPFSSPDPRFYEIGSLPLSEQPVDKSWVPFTPLLCPSSLLHSRLGSSLSLSLHPLTPALGSPGLQKEVRRGGINCKGFLPLGSETRSQPFSFLN